MPAPDFGEIAERLRRSTVHVHGRNGGGSGVIWSAEGLIITNAHVAREEDSVVEMWNGRKVAGKVISRDGRRDLASLHVESAGLPAATPGDSDGLRPGELVIAVGNPLGFTGALSTGVVHAIGPLGGLGRRKWVQADVRLLPGNSGGPLADASGRVVGINTMVARGLALAVPSNTVEEFLRHGSGVSLGVVVQAIRDGLLVLSVAPGSAAETASLRAGDLLVGVEGRPFGSPDDLADALDRNAGRPLEVSFLRGDRHAVRHVAVRLPRRRMTAEAA
jgi:serine protease Do